MGRKSEKVFRERNFCSQNIDTDSLYGMTGLCHSAVAILLISDEAQRKNTFC